MDLSNLCNIIHTSNSILNHLPQFPNHILKYSLIILAFKVNVSPSGLHPNLHLWFLLTTSALFAGPPSSLLAVQVTQPGIVLVLSFHILHSTFSFAYCFTFKTFSVTTASPGLLSPCIQSSFP